MLIDGFFCYCCFNCLLFSSFSWLPGSIFCFQFGHTRWAILVLQLKHALQISYFIYLLITDKYVKLLQFTILCDSS